MSDFLLKDFDNQTRFSQFVGYPSLLPLAFGMLEYGSKSYKASIELIRKRMDTGNGIASITIDSPFYLQNRGIYL